MNQFDKPTIVTDIDLTFGGDMKVLLPNYDEVPEEFKRSFGKWQDVVSGWFFRGLNLEEVKLTPKEGIDMNQALRHCMACLKSFQPKHEHKIAGVAYLMSRWFDYEP